MKAKAKKDATSDLKEKRKTGGGPKEKTIDELSQKIINMLPQQIYGLKNEYDDDHVSFVYIHISYSVFRNLD